jgi:hypothetical protein
VKVRITQQMRRRGKNNKRTHHMLQNSCMVRHFTYSHTHHTLYRNVTVHTYVCRYHTIPVPPYLPYTRLCTPYHRLHLTLLFDVVPIITLIEYIFVSLIPNVMWKIPARKRDVMMLLFFVTTVFGDAAETTTKLPYRRWIYTTRERVVYGMVPVWYCTVRALYGQPKW